MKQSSLSARPSRRRQQRPANAHARGARPGAKPRRKPAGTSKKTAAADTRIRRAIFAAWRAAEGKKAQDTVVLDVRGLADFTDYFLITEGANARQVEAIAEAIEQAVEKAVALAAGRGGGPRLAHREGGPEAEWRVLDYLDFVVHIFSVSSRRFYSLERLWQKAPRLAPPAAGRKVKA